MPKYAIYATRTNWYKVEVEATNKDQAYKQVEDWVSDDFEDYQTHAEWYFDVEEVKTKESNNA